MYGVLLIGYVSNAPYEMGLDRTRSTVSDLWLTLALLSLFPIQVLLGILLWYAHDGLGRWLGDGVRDDRGRLRMLPCNDGIQIHGVGSLGQSDGQLAGQVTGR